VAIKLFRTTGYSSLLAAGEGRVAMHPGWIVAAASAWVGGACNVALWRAFAHSQLEGLEQAVVLGVCIAGISTVILSLLGWRRTIKPAATLILLAGALAACSLWVQGLPMDAALLDRPPRGVLLPPWASLLGWRVPALLVGLGAAPIVWVWHSRLRRLSARQQLSATVFGVLLGAAMVAGSGFLLATAAG
jgi:glucan phosphoethanolaminetransferase (alkaline phosphatase superfamily)